MDVLLDASLSHDHATRAKAEVSLSTEVTALQLVEFVKTATNHAQRLSALVYLKNYVLQHWSSQLAEYRGRLCPFEERHSIRHECYNLIGDSDRLVRLQAGYIVSKIIAVDYPEEWATVLDDLINILGKPPTEAWLHGALVVMKGVIPWTNSLTSG